MPYYDRIHCKCVGRLKLQASFRKSHTIIWLFCRKWPVKIWHFATRITASNACLSTEWILDCGYDSIHPQLQISFCQRATNYRARLWKETCQDKASYACLSPYWILVCGCDSFHWKCCIPEIHQLEKVRYLGISLLKFKWTMWFNLNLYREIWVSGSGWFWECRNFSGICHT